VAEAMTWPGIIGLGEMMNFPGVFMRRRQDARRDGGNDAAGKVIGGHYASPDLGRPFHGYVAGGPADDHEGTRLEDAIARVRQGMKAMLRLGSAWYDVAAQVKAITEHGAGQPQLHPLHRRQPLRHAGPRRPHEPRRAPRHRPGAAADHGHPDGDAQHGQHFGVEKDIGSITPGRYADIVISSDLAALPIEMVIAGGEVVAENGASHRRPPPYSYPDFAKGTVKLGKRLEAPTFDFNIPAAPPQIKLRNPQSAIQSRVIGVVENQAPTRALERDAARARRPVSGDPAQDVCQIALVERHRATGGVVNGFVGGFGFNVPCAVASTVAHDSHHMIVVGTDAAEHGPGRQPAGRGGRRGGGFKDG
jgi:adenine deaminase